MLAVTFQQQTEDIQDWKGENRGRENTVDKTRASDAVESNLLIVTH